MAAAAAVLAIGPLAAQPIQNVDPNQPNAWQNAPAPTTAPQPEPAQSQAAPPRDGASADYTPIEGQSADQSAPADQQAAPEHDQRTMADRATEQANTVPRHDVFNAAESVFGRGAQGLTLEAVGKELVTVEPATHN